MSAVMAVRGGRAMPAMVAPDQMLEVAGRDMRAVAPGGMVAVDVPARLRGPVMPVAATPDGTPVGGPVRVRGRVMPVTVGLAVMAAPGGQGMPAAPAFGAMAAADDPTRLRVQATPGAAVPAADGAGRSGSASGSPYAGAGAPRREGRPTSDRDRAAGSGRGASGSGYCGAAARAAAVVRRAVPTRGELTTRIEPDRAMPIAEGRLRPVVDGLVRPEVAGQATGPASQDARAHAQAVRPAVSVVPSREVRGRPVRVEMMLGRIGARRPAGTPEVHVVSPRARVVNDVRTRPSRRPAGIGAASPAAAPELFASRRTARRPKRGEQRSPCAG